VPVIAAFGSLRQEDLPSSRPAWAIQRDSVSKINQNQNKKDNSSALSLSYIVPCL
jgi:hypothetical protein